MPTDDEETEDVAVIGVSYQRVERTGVGVGASLSCPTASWRGRRFLAPSVVPAAASSDGISELEAICFALEALSTIGGGCDRGEKPHASPSRCAPSPIIIHPA